MCLRSGRERLRQVVCYEFFALALSVPIYAFSAGHDLTAALPVMLAMSLAEMCWGGIHDSVYDWVDLQRNGIIADQRSNKGRAIHALSREASTAVVTVPVIMVMGGHSFVEALLLDAMLTLLYAAYAFVFFRVYDRVFPIKAAVHQDMLEA